MLPSEDPPWVGARSRRPAVPILAAITFILLLSALEQAGRQWVEPLSAAESRCENTVPQGAADSAKRHECLWKESRRTPWSLARPWLIGASLVAGTGALWLTLATPRHRSWAVSLLAGPVVLGIAVATVASILAPDRGRTDIGIGDPAPIDPPPGHCSWVVGGPRSGESAYLPSVRFASPSDAVHTLSPNPSQFEQRRLDDDYVVLERFEGNRRVESVQLLNDGRGWFPIEVARSVPRACDPAFLQEIDSVSEILAEKQAPPPASAP